MHPARILPLLACTLLITAAQAAPLDQLPPYPGWDETTLLTSKSNGQTSLFEIIRKSDNPKQPGEFLTINVYPASFLKPGAGPGPLLTLMNIGVYSACDQAKVAPVKEAEENGYKVAYAQFYCSKQKGKEYGVINQQKAIKGEKSIYIVQREWRVKPFEFENGDKNSFTLSPKSFGSEAEAKQLFDAMQTASGYLHKTVTVCGKDELEGLCGV